ncbi:MAG: T9SS type A sorting domain-containing protein, partial [Bacteroidales bacterium]|nr:T9SS type A sorting domain-containing protein [Bacteroidales bacterium]
WNFNEGTGTTAYDATSNANDGTITGATWSTDVPPNPNFSLQFDGVDDYVDMGDVDEVEGLNEISIEAWIKPNNLNTQRIFIVVKEDVWYLQIEQWGNDEVLIFGIHGQDPACSYILPSLGEWYYVVGVDDGVTTSLFVNAIEVDNISSIPIPISTYKLSIGARYNNGLGWEDFFEGNIDEIAIWDYALTQQEIQYNMYNELVGNETGLISYWNFNEGTGNTLYDQTSNNNNGIINGATWSTDVPFPLLPSDLTWSLQIESFIGSCFDNDNYLGVAEGATYGYDIGLDQVEPPFPPGDYIATYFPHPEWSYPLGDNFTLDAFPETVLDDTMQVWHFDVETNQVGDVTLTFNFTDIPAFPVILEDEQTGIHWEINHGDTYTFESSSSRSINHFNIAIGDITPPTAEWTYPNGLDIFQSDSLITLTWNAADNYQLDSVYVAYSNDGGTVYNDIITLNNEQEYEWTFPGWYYEDDVYFRIISEDHAGNTAEDVSDYATIVSGDSLEISVDAGWTLWGAPFDPYDSDMVDNLSDDLTDWVTYDYVNGGYTFDGVLILGEGYWLGSAYAGNVDILGEIATNPQEVDMATGWNIVSNPLVVDVPKTNLNFNEGTETKTWAEAVTAGWIIDQLYGWDGSAYTDETTFEYWKAYWIGATIDLTMYVENLAPTDNSEDSREIFMVDLTAETPNGEIDRTIGLGHYETATANYDIGLDIPKAPNSPNSTLSLAIPHPEWNHILGDDFAVDIRPEVTGNEINTWWLEGITGEEVTLSWDFESLPDELNVDLYIGEQIIDMTSVLSILVSVDDFSSFEIRASFANTETGDIIKPILTKLHGNYPNPFNPTTNIKFDLNETLKVQIDIFNIKGQKVNTLINSELDSGNHSIVWNGNDSSGKKVSSGIYFYKMKAGKYQETKKMILLK